MAVSRGVLAGLCLCLAATMATAVHYTSPVHGPRLRPSLLQLASTVGKACTAPKGAKLEWVALLKYCCDAKPVAGGYKCGVGKPMQKIKKKMYCSEQQKKLCNMLGSVCSPASGKAGDPHDFKETSQLSMFCKYKGKVPPGVITPSSGSSSSVVSAAETGKHPFPNSFYPSPLAEDEETDLTADQAPHCKEGKKPKHKNNNKKDKERCEPKRKQTKPVAPDLPVEEADTDQSEKPLAEDTAPRWTFQLDNGQSDTSSDNELQLRSHSRSDGSKPAQK